MTLAIIFRRAARNEFDEAADWYEQRRTGRGVKFAATIRKLLERIAEQPEFYPQVFEEVREARVTGYPYCVYYRAEGEQVIVLAVFHTARDPSIWQERT